MSFTRIVAALLMMVLPAAGMADTLALRPDHPQTYVVRKGDTLWDISAHFLATPWLWPRLWQANPQVANPHLIYPGDRLQLIWVNGEPRLVRKKRVTLSPEPRAVPKAEPIPTIPLAAIGAFLPQDRIVMPDSLEQAPRILGGDRGTIRMVSHEQLYASERLPTQQAYGIYRPGQRYVDPDSGAVLGQRLNFIAAATVSAQPQEDQYTALEIVRDFREAHQGDRLLPLHDAPGIDAYFIPTVPRPGLQGVILDSAKPSLVMSKHDVVFVSLGARDGLQVGDVLRIFRPGKQIVVAEETLQYRERAPLAAQWLSDTAYQLPDAGVGELLIFRTFDSMALGLVTRAEDLIRRDYRVSSG